MKHIIEKIKDPEELEDRGSWLILVFDDEDYTMKWHAFTEDNIEGHDNMVYDKTIEKWKGVPGNNK